MSFGNVPDVALKKPRQRRCSVESGDPAAGRGDGAQLLRKKLLRGLCAEQFVLCEPPTEPAHAAERRQIGSDGGNRILCLFQIRLCLAFQLGQAACSSFGSDCGSASLLLELIRARHSQRKRQCQP